MLMTKKIKTEPAGKVSAGKRRNRSNRGKKRPGKRKPEELRDHVIRFFEQNQGRPVKTKHVFRELRLPEGKYEELRQTMRALFHDGILSRKGKSYVFTKKEREIVERVSIKKGYGLIKPPGVTYKVFVAQLDLDTALDGDIVRVQLFAEKVNKRNEIKGRVVEVVQRGRSTIIGTFQRNENFNFVVPDDKKVHRDLYIPDGKTHSAKVGQKVVAQVEKWDDVRLNPEGKIIEILGFPNEKGVDVASVARSFDISFSFGREVGDEVAKISDKISKQEIKRRLDLRDQQCVTIDPVDAKDFDDAICLEILEDETYKLSIHIADVSYYVREQSLIDREALKRATSIYLVDRVIPMLPEKLSNNLCSLRPMEDRLAYSVIAHLNKKGRLLDYQIAETVIKSKHRFAYEEVQEILEGNVGTEHSSAMINMLYEMRDLSKILNRDRLKQGSIDFDTLEAKFIMDEAGVPIEVYKKERLDAHRLVEEFMLLANRIVSSHGTEATTGRNGAFIYRVHDKPDQEKLEGLARLLNVLGYHFDLVKKGKKFKSKQIQNVIDQSEGKKENSLIKSVALRTMAKAEYSTTNIGHFGLAFTHYSHFTSPIRRYPDLVVHRLLKKIEAGVKQHTDLEKVARHCSEQERVAVDAERKSIKLKQAEFLEKHVGDRFDGIISGVASHGLYVEINDFLIEGLLHISELHDDYYIFDQNHYRLIGQVSHKVYQLGDQVRIRVVRVDRESLEIDFTLA